MSRHMEIEEFNERVKRTNILQWTVVVVYILVTMALGFLPLFVQLDELGFVVGYNALVFGGMFILFFVLLYPFIKKETIPDAQDGKLLDGIIDKEKLPAVYYERMRTFIVYEIIIPFAIIMAAWGAYYLITEPGLGEGFWVGMINISTTLFLILLLVPFGHLEVHATDEHLHFHYGPFGKKVKYSEIKSIRSTSIHAFRDYKGWGIRAGPDGSWGYISRGNVGVRLTLTNDKNYVITVSDPDTLVQYVRVRKGDFGEKEEKKGWGKKKGKKN